MEVSRIMSVLGARPQFIKAAMVSRALRGAGIDEFLVHSGQHYDDNMSKIFFEDMEIPEPHRNLGVGSGSHAYQTGETMKRLERLCAEVRPDALLVYGDTNTTLSGALVGAKMGIGVGHVEAGLRSFDRSMPEEVNRIVTDHVSAWLFCPTKTAVGNLASEGITIDVYHTGDVMYDAALHFGDVTRERSTILGDLGLKEKSYVLVTIHRDFNTDNPGRLAGIVNGLAASGEKAVFPVHPRARKMLDEFDLMSRVTAASNVQLIDPVGYLDMLRLEMAAKAILTDSGGVQKEAFFHGVPCITVRPSTEWVETVETEWNRLTGADEEAIVGALTSIRPGRDAGPLPYGDGQAAEVIADALVGTIG